MNASAFQGVGSLREPMRLAVASGKGLFVLAATSNPESWPLQRARLIDDDGHRSVSRAIIDDVTAFDRAVQADGVAPIGLVLGATVPFDAYGIDIAQAPTPALPVLAPGFGHQGAALGDARDRFGAWSAAMIVSESRSVLAAGPGGIRDAVRRRAGEVQDALG
jgi:orotidine-5'-phosphate decarboxylase